MNKEIRWKQRFDNLNHAFNKLNSAVSEVKNLSPLEKEGVIQRFEYTFELCWKTLKDYLESVGVEAQFPRDVIKKSFQYELIGDGDIWINMLDKRNLLAHCYDEKLFEQAVALIVCDFHPQIKLLHQTLKVL
jgi:nucleotidyltransferase substrate binding protein (TIGR01987 family)